MGSAYCLSSDHVRQQGLSLRPEGETKKMKLFVLLGLVATSDAFAPSGLRASVRTFGTDAVIVSTRGLVATRAMTDLGSASAFDRAIKDAGDALVVVDFATTWCRPCKVTPASL